MPLWSSKVSVGERTGGTAKPHYDSLRSCQTSQMFALSNKRGKRLQIIVCLRKERGSIMIRLAALLVMAFLAVLIVADFAGKPVPYGYRILAGLIVAFGIAIALTSSSDLPS